MRVIITHNFEIKKISPFEDNVIKLRETKRASENLRGSFIII